MQIQPQANCPLDGFNPCRQTGCGWFTRLAGTNPNTGAETDEWGCAMAWLPLLLIETAGQSRQTGAAVESFRNAVLQAAPTPDGPVSSGPVSADRPPPTPQPAPARVGRLPSAGDSPERSVRPDGLVPPN